LKTGKSMFGRRFLICALIMLLICPCFSVYADAVSTDQYWKTIPYLPDDMNVRFDVSDFVGGDYGNLLSATNKVSVLKMKETEIKIGNSNVSITAKTDGTITRVRLDSTDRDYCVEGICSNLGTSDANFLLNNAGYVEGNPSVDGEWRIFTNEAKGRFLAYKAQFASIDQLYYGLIGYMPISQK